ncbi:TAXI family TRAP transporter solute-binding subunit [Terribacillus saccharophilus]|uniref:C4-dicarboxylate ABC transporter substrate-binding protein n=1 Tax=Terribacillus saccharophilus TaxID=361277 RepID=A0A268A709_9BACI|nr:TAXI family TRAP transporter solute-binding subunit [Terribacillus saccharophilus]PAD19915.1 C4-dicarboxylate ABC transporter substrate-binding protein [Terribacillus saccharophilus]PAF20461.1 C4-dicarboxylate ABC transporter substrate-binding protein [Terribacillus saccharophilus]PAF38177.1 C4-dicarboxylate ABC transporter substrate-binding protein [Terribacillus saccharophilus]
MKMKKSLSAVVLMTLLALILSACGGGTTGGSGDSGGDEEGGQQFITLLTGGTEGTYYPLGGSIAEILNSNVDDVKATATSTGASVENMNTLSEGNDDIVAFTQTDIAAYATDGKLMFDGKPIDSIRAIGSLYPETIQIVATEASGIKTVEDLKGKTVSIGAPGSGTNASAEDILKLYGMTVDDVEAQNLDFGESTAGMQDGNIDAAFITAGTPTGAIESLAATTPVTIVGLEQDKIDQLLEELPYYAAYTIEAGTYDLEEPVETVSVNAMLVTTEGMDEELVYNMTKALYENTGDIGHQKAEFIKAETAADGVSIPFHPGAQRYLEEAGVELPSS